MDIRRFWGVSDPTLIPKLPLVEGRVAIGDRSQRGNTMRKSNKLKSTTLARKRETRKHKAIRKAAARAGQNHRTPIARIPSDGLDPVLSRLSDKFRDNIDWIPPKGREATRRDIDNYAVGMFRRPFEPDPRLDNNFLAVNSKTYNDEKMPLEYQQGLQGLLWQDVLQYIRPMPIDFVKSGSAIWDKLDLQTPKDLVEDVVAVHNIDPDTYRAVNAALFTAYNTSAGSADMETVAAALATFIHAHPRFKEIADEGEFHQPFGEDTFWKLSKPFEY